MRGEQRLNTPTKFESKLLNVKMTNEKVKNQMLKLFGIFTSEKIENQSYY